MRAPSPAPERRPGRLPPLPAIAAFEAIARHRSFTKAAAELCVTRSAVSHRLRELEGRLGVSLVDRDTTPVGLTHAGETYLASVRDALVALAGAGTLAKQDRARRRIVVASPPTFARQVLVPRLQQFREAHGAIEIDVELAIPLRDVQAANAELEVRFGRGLYPAFVTLDLLDEPVFAVCTPRYRAEHRLDTPAALEKSTLLRSELEPWAPWFAAAGLFWPEPDTGPRYEDLALLYQAAIDGEGVALARATLARPALESGALVRPFAITARSPHAYYLACKPSALQRPEVQTFVQWLRASVRELHTR